MKSRQTGKYRKGGLLMALLSLGILLAGCGTKAAAKAITSNEISPILDQEGADPFVMQYGDGYLYTKTTGHDISIAAVDSIETLGAAELQCVYEPGSALQDLWAPEIWNLDGEWYIYFAATVPGESIHRMYVLHNTAENPLEGEWTLSPVVDMDDKFAIDGTVMELDGKRYFIWSGWEGDENVRQDIYLAEMASPCEVKAEKILLSKPELAWEKSGNPLVNEGPEVVVRGNTVNLIYSASGSWTDDYCLGLLTLEAGQDPKIPANWTKQNTPILSKTDTVYGPGHNCFTKAADGQQDLIIYHAARWQGAGWARGVRYGTVAFDENGKLLPMEPVAGDAMLPLPSGEGEVARYPADCFTVTGEIETVNADPGYFKGFEYTQDSVTLEIESAAQKQACLVVFARCTDPADGVAASLELTLGAQSMAKDLYAGEDFAPVYFPVQLEAGTNEVRINSYMGGTTIELLQVEVRG